MAVVWRHFLFRTPLVFLLFLTTILYIWSTFQLHSQITNHSTNNLNQNHGEFQAKLKATFENQVKMAMNNSMTFSACLLVMDDNHFLIEWLAYHYHVLPLRYLVIATDPRSATSPHTILQRWREQVNDFTIVEWKDDDFMTDLERQEATDHVRIQFRRTGIQNQPHLIEHRARQRLFYYKCMLHLKKKRRRWTVMIDTDEFLHVNYHPNTMQSIINSSTLPPGTYMNEPGSVMKFLKAELKRPGQNLTSACVQIPRLRYGAKETYHLDERVAPSLPGDVYSPFNISHFQTLRWNYHALALDHTANKISKTMIDLGRVRWQQIEPVQSIHRPIWELCGHRRLYITAEQQVFVINHYLGTLEQYFFRNDSRTGKERSLDVYDKVKAIDDENDDQVHSWLQGFVKVHGLEKAAALLTGVGKVDTTLS